MAAKRTIISILLAIVLSLVLLIGAGYMAVMWKLKQDLREQLTRALQQPVSVGSLYVNPLTGSMTVRNLHSQSDSLYQFAFAVDEVDTQWDIKAWMRGEQILRHLYVQGWHLTLVWDEEGKFCAPDLSRQGRGEGIGLQSLRINDIRFSEGECIRHYLNPNNHISDTVEHIEWSLSMLNMQRVDNEIRITIADNGNVTIDRQEDKTNVAIQYEESDMRRWSARTRNWIAYPQVEGSVLVTCQLSCDSMSVTGSLSVRMQDMELGERQVEPCLCALPLKSILRHVEDENGLVAIDLPIEWVRD